ncbi:annexin-B12-like [Babylonia areolata]|uniref:annexin-B12-like n=1 Tax=Babylonia areolata TaxID=304850 RepID=UPI003FD06A54
MSYPPPNSYSGGYPPAGGGYPPTGGYPPMGGYPSSGGYPQAGGGGFSAPGGHFAMPTPESAHAAAYHTTPGGPLPYAAQPGYGPGGQPPGPGIYPPLPSVAMPSAPSAMQPTYTQPGFGGPLPYPSQSQPGSYPPQISAPSTFYPPPPGYGAPPVSGGYPPSTAPYGASQPGYPSATTPDYRPPDYGAPSYGAPGQYGAPPSGQYGPPATAGGYGAPATTSSAGYSGAGSTAYGKVPPAASYVIREEGTLKPYPRFSAEEDVQKLRKAMKGFGTDEQALVNVLAYRSNDQRQNLKLMFKTCFGRDLVQDLKSELSGCFQDAMIALMYRPEEFDAAELRRAMKGLGTDEAALIEILCTRTNAQIHAITNAYKQMYGRKLDQDIISETSGHFRKLLVSMCAGGRLEQQPVDLQKAQTDAQRIYQAGERRWGTDESMFNMVLASQSYEQLRAVFDAYSRVSGKDIEHAIKSEMSGDLATGMLTIVRMIRSKHGYFAERLYHSMKGMGTDDRTLIRIVVSRCEVDMKQIKEEFHRRYSQSLDAFIRDDTSGDYRRLLTALIGGVS